MSSKNQAIMAGAFAVAIALAAIVGSVYFLPSPKQQQNGTNGISTETATTLTASGGNVASSSSSVSSATAAQSSQVQTQPVSQVSPSDQGNLSILLTDPPTVPAGVTAIYVTYSNVAVHVGDAGNESGWTNANATGTINLMQMVNVSSTIATVKVTTGVYNALRFNVSSAQVVYNGENYTAFIPKAELTVAILGGIQVNTTSTAGAIIDMHPTVLNIGSKSTPEFIVDTAASVFSVPPGTITKAIEHVGDVMRIDNQNWWQHINEEYTANVQITAASVTNSSLSVTVKNTGTQSVTLGTITVAPLGSECATPTANSQDQRAAPVCFTGSAVFLVQNDSSLKTVSQFVLPPIIQTIMTGHSQDNGGGGSRQSSTSSMTTSSTTTTTSSSTTTTSQSTSYPGSTGYTLAPGQSVTLTYSGSINFGFAFFGRAPPGVLSGDQYQITAVGQEALAETVAVAT